MRKAIPLAARRIKLAKYPYGFQVVAILAEVKNGDIVVEVALFIIAMVNMEHHIDTGGCRRFHSSRCEPALLISASTRQGRPVRPERGMG